jgi:Zn-finger nucleic acid-binding protein
VLCPACAGELRPSDHQGIALSRCPRCAGAWLDRHGVRKLLEQTRADAGGKEPPATPRGRMPEPARPDVPFYDFG